MLYSPLKIVNYTLNTLTLSITGSISHLQVYWYSKKSTLKQTKISFGHDWDWTRSSIFFSIGTITCQIYIHNILYCVDVYRITALAKIE